MKSLVLTLLALWAVGVTWGSGYAVPDYRDALASGYGNPDILYYASYAAMFKTYNTPSTGLDGLPVVPYHFGSIWLAAQIARVLHVSALDVYNRVYPILLPILFLVSFLWFVIGLHPKHRSGVFWAVLLCGIVRVVPQPLADNWGMLSSSLLSESNALAFTLTFVTAGLIARGAYHHRWFI